MVGTSRCDLKSSGAGMMPGRGFAAPAGSSNTSSRNRRSGTRDPMIAHPLRFLSIVRGFAGPGQFLVEVIDRRDDISAFGQMLVRASGRARTRSEEHTSEL